MSYETKYNLLDEIDYSGEAKKIYDLYMAISMAQQSNRIIIEDFTVSSITGIPLKHIRGKKKLLQDFDYIRYNNDEKMEIIKKNNIIAYSSMIEIVK